MDVGANTIQYYVACFERYLYVTPKNSGEKKLLEHLIDNLYDEWNDGPDELSGVCCEEYIVARLENLGFEFDFAYDEDDDDEPLF